MIRFDGQALETSPRRKIEAELAILGDLKPETDSDREYIAALVEQRERWLTWGLADVVERGEDPYDYLEQTLGVPDTQLVDPAQQPV